MVPTNVTALTALILVGMASAAAADCLPAATLFSKPFANPCGTGKAMASSAAAATKRSGPNAPLTTAPRQAGDEDDDSSISLPLASGVGLDGKLGTDRTSLPTVRAIDDAANRRRTAQPRTPVFSEAGLRGGAVQSVRRKAGDGALLGLTFDLPQ